MFPSFHNNINCYWSNPLNDKKNIPISTKLIIDNNKENYNCLQKMQGKKTV